MQAEVEEAITRHGEPGRSGRGKGREAQCFNDLILGCPRKLVNS